MRPERNLKIKDYAQSIPVVGKNESFPSLQAAASVVMDDYECGGK
jgi:hypothetical protein